MALRPTIQDIVAQNNSLQMLNASDERMAADNADQNKALRGEQVDAAHILNTLALAGNARDSQLRLEAESTKKAVGDLYGANISDPNSQLAYLANEQKQAVRNANEHAKAAQNLIQTNLWDDPLTYMLQRPFAHREIAASDAETERATNLQNAIVAINADVPATIKTQQALQETYNAADAERNLQIASLTAGQKLAELRIQNNNSNLTDLEKLSHIKKERFATDVTTYKLINEQYEFNARMAEHHAARKQRENAKLGQIEAMERYNRGAVAFGKKTFSDPDKFMVFANLNKDEANALISRGGLEVNGPYIASSPGVSQVTLEQVNGKLPETASRLGNFLSTETNFAKQELQANKEKLTAETVAQRANLRMLGGDEEYQDGKTKGKRKVTGSFTAMAQDVEADPYSGKVQNVYGPPALSTVEALPLPIKDMVGYDDIIRTASLANPGRVVTADGAVQQAYIAIKKGLVKPEDATDMVQNYFKAVALTNNTLENYKAVGAPQQVTYRAHIRDPIMGKVQQLDVMNDREKLLMNFMKASLIGKVN